MFTAYGSAPLSAIQASQSILLTGRLSVGAKVNIIPLPSTGSLKYFIGLPSLRQVKEAGTVSLKEISRNLPPPSTSADAHVKDKRRDWLTLLVRESLGMHFLRY
jgi:AAA family ATPase